MNPDDAPRAARPDPLAAALAEALAAETDPDVRAWLRSLLGGESAEGTTTPADRPPREG